MRILLDECVDPRSKQYFDPRHYVSHVREEGWLGTKNGQLVALADPRFEVLFTKDSNMAFQTSLKGLRLCVTYTRAHPQSLLEYRAVVQRFEELCDALPAGEYVDLDDGAG